MTWDKNLSLKHLDEALAAARPQNLPVRPSGGWLKAIRTALGMSTRQLGARIGVSQSRVSSIEKGEADGSITLNTLEKAAAGLGCRVVYMLVPEEGSLQRKRELRARQKVLEDNIYIERHMQLEDQATKDSFKKELVERFASKLLSDWPRDLWDD